MIIYSFGLERLGTVSRVDVRQRDVTTDLGEVIFNLKRELIGRTSIRFNLHDKTDREVISLRPVFSFIRPRLEIFVEDELASQLRMKCLFSCSPTYFICSPQNRKMLKIRAPPFGQTRFVLRLKDFNRRQIGTVTKKWNGEAEEIFSDSNEFQVDFSKELEVPYKAAVIGFCVLIIQDANMQNYDSR